MKSATGGSRLSAYASRSMAGYVILSLPAILLEVAFSVSIASSPGISGIAQRLGGIGSVVGIVLSLVPWLFVVASAVAVLYFRSSLVLTLLVGSYFVLSVVEGSAAAAGPLSLTPEVSAAAVVIATFLALMAFSFARAAKLRGSTPPIIRTKGSALFRAIGLSLDFAVPAVIAVILVVVTIEMFSPVKDALTSLPPPLSGVFSSSISGPIAAVGITLLVAGIILWLVRELIEPWVMYYSITRQDAVKLLEEDLSRLSKKAETVHRRNIRGTFLTAVVILAIAGVLYLYFGTGAVLRDLPSLYGAHQPGTYTPFVQQTNAYYRQVQGDINAIARLLWG